MPASLEIKIDVAIKIFLKFFRIFKLQILNISGVQHIYFIGFVSIFEQIKKNAQLVNQFTFKVTLFT